MGFNDLSCPCSDAKCHPVGPPRGKVSPGCHPIHWPRIFRKRKLTLIQRDTPAFERCQGVVVEKNRKIAGRDGPSRREFLNKRYRSCGTEATNYTARHNRLSLCSNNNAIHGR